MDDDGNGVWGVCRSVARPVLVHCKDGGNKSGTVCALLAAMAEVSHQSI
jgi:protein tyrosine/serine phosphatase